MKKSKRIELKYGCNPNQKPAAIFMENGDFLPVEILNGRPGYINFLDAFNGWQLVRELKAALKMPAATSFKHVSPTSAAIGISMTDELKRACFVEDIDGLDDSAIASAYARARGTDRMSSFGDFVALSDECDETTAMLIKREVSDGIIAPGFTEKALDILKTKKNGNYNIIKIDPDYEPGKKESKQVFGITFEQGRNDRAVTFDDLAEVVTINKDISDDVRRDMIVALITLKYTQSNSVCYARDGQTIGVGAGQQSRIHCTRLAGDKADFWHLRQSPQVLNLPFREEAGRPARDNAIDIFLSDRGEELSKDGNWEELFKEKPTPFSRKEQREFLKNITGVTLGSDAFFPFGDNIERAAMSGVRYVVQPGGSVRDRHVIDTCNKYGMTMVFTGLRLFHH